MNTEKPKNGGGQPASILVVDDIPANLQVLASMLKGRGYKVRPVPSGKLALLAARCNPPDLILLDIHMPEMNGYEVCEHLNVERSIVCMIRRSSQIRSNMVGKRSVHESHSPAVSR